MGYVIIRDEGRTLVGNDDGDVLPLAGRAKITTRPVSFIAKLINGNILLLDSTASSNILTRSKIS